MSVFGPTHWDVRPDVRRVANRVAERFDCTWNTYRDHPPGAHLDEVSVDFWGSGGRGDNLPRDKRRKIARYLRQREGLPRWLWIINGNRGYLPNGERFTPPGGRLWNGGHVHVTFE
jgi:hypothetical protein